MADPMPRPSPTASPQTTHFYNTQLFRSGLFADCTITTTARSPSAFRTFSSASPATFACHRSILSPRCAFFRCCLDGRFAEGGSRVISMDDDDPVALEAMLFYLYTLEYPAEIGEALMALPDWRGGFGGAGSGKAGGSDSGIEDDDEVGVGREGAVYWGFDWLVFVIAEKYGLEELREMAAARLLEKAIALSGEEKNGRGVDGFVGLVESLYAAEDVSEPGKELRCRIVEVTAGFVAQSIRISQITQLVADTPEFAIDLVSMLGKKEEESRKAKMEEVRQIEREKLRIRHVPMNEDSDGED